MGLLFKSQWHVLTQIILQGISIAIYLDIWCQNHCLLPCSLNIIEDINKDPKGHNEWPKENSEVKGSQTSEVKKKICIHHTVLP